MGVGDSDGIGGVPLDQLHCPTCGTRFTDYSMHVDSEEEFQIEQTTKEIMVNPAHWRRFLRCPQGHKWTVKTVWRVHNRPEIPDRVQLDRYLGGGR